MITKKTLTYISLGMLLSMVNTTFAETVDCASNPKYAEYKCDVCYDGGNAQVDNTGITLPEEVFGWENKLDGINQNFYKDSQSPLEIETNIGTKPTKWDELGIEWGDAITWKKYGGTDTYIVISGGKIDMKKIVKDTKIPLTDVKSNTSNYFVLKIPISYNEVKAGEFELGATKTSNYCISYTPKISATANTTTTTTTPPVATPATTPPTTTTTPAPTTTPPTTPIAPIPKPTTVTTPTTTTTTPTTTTTTPVTPKPTATPVTTTTTPTTTTTTTTPPATTTTSTIPPKPPVANTQTTGIVPTSTSTNTAIPAYNPSVSLNSAGNDPKLSAASKVASGPAENMYILIAAVLLSAILYPKIRKTNS